MNCPVCKSVALVAMDLDTNLSSLACAQCGGHWINGAEYWKWLEKHANIPETAAEDEGLSLAEPGVHIDCPECRFRMVKYLVGRGMGFTLDHCQGCKGIWLDRNEWEALRKRNLHDDLNSMLTAFWQGEARREARKKRLEEIYVSRFGAENYAEIKKIRSWLDTVENKEEVLAYLADKDPFEI